MRLCSCLHDQHGTTVLSPPRAAVLAQISTGMLSQKGNQLAWKPGLSLISRPSSSTCRSFIGQNTRYLSLRTTSPRTARRLNLSPNGFGNSSNR
jgi:hypothetical protein